MFLIAETARIKNIEPKNLTDQASRGMLTRGAEFVAAVDGVVASGSRLESTFGSGMDR